MNLLIKKTPTAFSSSALVLTGLRWVMGWLFFSAFWRRLILENKLDPDGLGYVGEKFNSFLPNALFIKPMIQYLVTHPESLFTFMVLFTLIEALIGLGLLLGFFTRLSALGGLLVSAGILLGAGWIGSTCLDEWQIGVLGIVSSLVLMISGSSDLSVDQWLLKKQPLLEKYKWFTYLCSGDLYWNANTFRILSLALAAGSLGVTLFTNQYFHGGVWGKLHNLSIRPHIDLTDIHYTAHQGISFDMYRDQGIDTYGAFIYRISLLNEKGTVVKVYDTQNWATLPASHLHNYHVAKVKTGKHSLVIPLGAKARLLMPTDELPTGRYKIEVEDISGKTWQKAFSL